MAETREKLPPFDERDVVVTTNRHGIVHRLELCGVEIPVKSASIKFDAGNVTTLTLEINLRGVTVIRADSIYVAGIYRKPEDA